jgi:hyperosmotically inducible protein
MRAGRNVNDENCSNGHARAPTIAERGFMNRSVRSLVCGIALTGAFLIPGTIEGRQNQPAPDNTKVNQRDRNSAEPTADQGKNNSSDRELMRRIRRDVVKDKSLSTYGHNVKIIAEHGKVTLKGPVHSEEEKNTIARYAQQAAGSENVTNELTVKDEQK